MNTREAALKTLYEIEWNGAYSNLALKKTLNSDLSSQDKAFITLLVYGVTDKRITLDYIIQKHSKLKLKKISKYILIILRMGIYQLKFMDKVPESAAVNESVKIAKRYGHGASVGFVNGVLRSAAKTDVDFPADKTEYLSVKYSFPKDLCIKWINDFGYDFTEKLLKAFSEPPKLTLRPNTLKTTVEGLLEKLTEMGIKAGIIDGYITTNGFDIAHDELYKNGYYTVQDAAAMTASKVLAPNEGETVIDMCAAPGGKTTHMAEIMKNSGKIYAFDVHGHKIDLIKKNAKRLGISIIEAKTGDGQVYNKEYAAAADKVLCDVPCSGYGIIRRKPEIKYTRADTAGLPKIQRTILDNAAKYVRGGGDIVYSTCTIEKEENENVTDGFLKSNPGFEKQFEKTFYPHTDNTDGFYICKMRRTK